MKKTLAYDLALEEWQARCSEWSLPPFIGKQIFQWIFQKGESNPLLFTNLALSLRRKLGEEFEWELPSIDSHLISKDKSEKFLLTTSSYLFEMVLMPYEERHTLCISSQVGCKMGCTFCQTGKIGFKKNLSSGEILSQLLLANRRLKEMGSPKRVTNVVFMGMGEPLDNYEEVLKACRIMLARGGFALSHSKVTISTSGLVEEIEKLGKDLPVRLAISLHSADNEKRSEMMPINKRYPLERLKEVLMHYPCSKREGITFEYVMIEGVNDSLQDAKKLVHFLHGLKAKVNLIPINHFPGVEMTASKQQTLTQFQSYLERRSISAPIRYSRGQDISGGCGQLAAKRENELHLDPRTLRRKRSFESKLNF